MINLKKNLFLKKTWLKTIIQGEGTLLLISILTLEAQ
ncbi:hypothetical protein PMIT1313_00203 [Prochlorococcus marinus str. MIT 1313]|nr:hypothetical protein PMIT1313_00203 [Prochlorococcus marinus str. MIT 1313]KZR76899.1 hypothetical protein PMIT1318_00106 [Prochlorococcus marinus str. MIT 1318]